ncbi:hypothetical protein V6N13_148425 [Hibiscus sabdariffa]
MGFFGASVRRKMRQHVQDSLEGSPINLDFAEQRIGVAEEDSVEKVEAKAVWSVSNLLEVSFNGGNLLDRSPIVGGSSRGVIIVIP